jgi:NAD(P)H-hydrate epimerase
MAQAAVSQTEACANAGDGAWLAAAALDHALAGLRCRERRGAGGATPLAVAEDLALGRLA